jgi:hypothetical protein
MLGPGVEALVARVVAGDAPAWQELREAVEPVAFRITGTRKLAGPLSERDDERHVMCAELMAHLHAGSFRCLRGFLEAHAKRGGSFERWFETVAVHFVIRHARGYGEPMPDPGPPGPASDLSPVVKVAQILAVAAEILTPEQLAAIQLRLEDLGSTKIAERLGLPGEKEAEDLIRAAQWCLLEHYAEDRET